MSAAVIFYFHLPSLNFSGVASNPSLSWFTHLGVLHSFIPSAHPPHHQWHWCWLRLHVTHIVLQCEAMKGFINAIDERGVAIETPERNSTVSLRGISRKQLHWNWDWKFCLPSKHAHTFVPEFLKLGNPYSYIQPPERGNSYRSNVSL